MGLPTTTEDAPRDDAPPTSEDKAPIAPPDAETSSSGAQPESRSELPPAALELAAKLFDLARLGDLFVLRQYLSAGIPANLTNSTGDSLLMLAAYRGHANVVRELLDRGADPNAINDRGQSPIAGAVFKGNDDVVGILFERGGDIRAGRPTAVETARMFRRREILELFGIDESQEPPLPGAPETINPGRMAPGGAGMAEGGS